MIKCEVIEDFTLGKYNELKNITRRNKSKDGKLYVGDTFECEQEMAKYLTGDNPLKKAVVKVIEVKVKEAKFEEMSKEEKEEKHKVVKATKKSTKSKK